MKYRVYKHYLLLLFLALALFPGKTQGQGAVDTSETSETVNNLKNIKISGYIHALYQKAGSPGIASFSGGDFEENVEQRFTVRRGRMKLTYDTGLSTAVVQIDATEEGVIIRDAYLRLTEPEWKTFGLQAGVQNRSFGHEVVYSSSLRESPERSRLFQTLFAGERDAGVKVFIEPPEESRLGFLQMEFGFYNGSGTAADYDNNKDFIARLHTGFEGKSSPWTLGLGASLYSGGQRQNSRYRYEIMGNNDFYSIDSAESNVGSTAKRRYYGLDLQVSYGFPFGNSRLRAEYIMGRQPGSSSSSRTPRSRPEEAVYQREFEGAYAVFIQQVGHSPLEAFIKYDFYDPNKEVRAIAINETFTEGDILYRTWGYGLAWKYDKRITFTAYYEDVENERTTLNEFEEDINDNVLSLRVQYRF